MNREKLKEELPRIVFVAAAISLVVILILTLPIDQEKAEQEAKVAEIEEKLKSVCTMHCELLEMQYYSSYIATDFSLESTRCRCLNREHELILYRLDKDGVFIKQKL